MIVNNRMLKVLKFLRKSEACLDTVTVLSLKVWVIKLCIFFLKKTRGDRKVIAKKGICQLASSLTYDTTKYRIVEPTIESDVSKHSKSKIVFLNR